MIVQPADLAYSLGISTVQKEKLKQKEDNLLAKALDLRDVHSNLSSIIDF